MSIDMQLYLCSPVSMQEVLSEIVSLGFQILESRSDEAVIGDSSSRYLFTLWGPFERSEGASSDLTEELSLEWVCKYGLVVEGSSSTGHKWASMISHGLLSRVKGVLIDPASSAGPFLSPLLSKSSAPRKSRRKRTGVVLLEWGFVGADSLVIIESYLRSAKQFLPGAWPEKIGEEEPPKTHFSSAGSARDLLEISNESIVLGGKLPLIEGSFSPPSEDWPWATLSLSFEWDLFRSPDQEIRLRKFFVNVADGAGSFYAYAKVYPKATYGRGDWQEGSGEVAASLYRGTAGWYGVPWRPVDWSWFGRAYRDLILELGGRFPGDSSGLGSGILCEWSSIADGCKNFDYLDGFPRDLVSPDIYESGKGVVPTLPATIPWRRRRSDPLEFS